MRGCKAVFGIVLFSAILSGCTMKEKTYDFYNGFATDQETPMDSSSSDSDEITDEEMDSVYRDAYGFAHLTEHHVLWDEEKHQVTVDFIFDEEADLWEINSARDYVLESYVFEQLLSLGNPQSYQNWAQEQEIQHVYGQVYINDVLLCQDYYQCQDRLVKDEFHYENASMTVEGQLYDSENVNLVREKLKAYLPQKTDEIVFKTNLRQQKLIVQITSKQQVNPDDLNKIEEELLALHEESKTVCLELYDSDMGEMYYQVKF